MTITPKGVAQWPKASSSLWSIGRASKARARCSEIEMVELDLWRASIGLSVSSRSRSSKPVGLNVVVARETRLFSAHDQQLADPPADGASCCPPLPRTELVVTSSPLLLLQVSRQLLLAAPSDLSHCSGRKPVRMEDKMAL